MIARFSRADALAMFLLTLATVIAYAYACANDFVMFDDHTYVTDNIVVQDGLTAQGVRYAFTTTDASNWHPLTWMSLELDAQIFSLQAWGFHLTNVLLHLANTLLLFWVLRRMTGFIWRSALVAALFAVHPLHVESVAWVSERKDVLSTLFWMLTLLAYLRYAEQPGLTRYLLVMLALALGLLAKPMLVTLPCVLLLLDYWPLGRWPQSKGEGHSARLGFLILEKVPLFLLSLGACLTTLYAQKRIMMPLESYPLSVRVGNAWMSYLVYIGKAVWPINLAAFYPHPRGSLPLWEVAGAAIFLAMITLIVLIQARRLPYLAVGWLWYVGTLVPVIGLVQVGTQGLADRYTYVPFIGLFILATWGIADLAARWHGQTYARAVAGVVLIALMLQTWIQVSYWHNTEALWRHALEVTQSNPVAEAGMGIVYEDIGETDQALQSYQRSLEIDPSKSRVHLLLGLVLRKQEKPDEALPQFEEALRLDPHSYLAEYCLGLFYADRGEIAKAIEHYRASVQAKSDYPIAQYKLGHLLFQTEKADEAVEHLHMALRLYTANQVHQERLAAALTARGNSHAASAHAGKGQGLRKELADTHYRLGETYAALADREQAREHFLAALELNPKQERALDGLAALDLAVDQPAEVVRLYAKPDQLKDKASAYRNLARAYAQQEHWQKAADEYRRALDLSLLPPETRCGLHCGLAVALVKLGQGDEARTQFHRAAEIDLNWQQSARKQAWSLATSPQAGRRNGRLALELAEQVYLASEVADSQVLDTLAAAYAEELRYSDAAATARKALAAASSASQKVQAQEIQRRLQLYERGQPFRTN